MTITIRTAATADSNLIRDLGVRIFSNTFGPANTLENMRAYLDTAFSFERVRAEVADPEKVGEHAFMLGNDEQTDCLMRRAV